jgi:outer membrane autotransporter protein
MISQKNSRRVASALLGSTAVIALALFGAAHADTNWTGAVSTDWFTMGNWDTNTVPTAGDVVTLDTLATNPTVIDTAAASASALVIGSSGSASGSLTITNGGSLTAQTAALGRNSPNSSGTITLQDGSMMSLTDSFTAFTVGETGMGHLNILSGSTLSANGVLIGYAHGSFGYADVSGAGSVLTTAALVVGVDGTASLTVENGAAVHTGAFVVSAEIGSGSVGITGTGTLVSAADLAIGSDRGTGTVTVENGAVFNIGNDTIVGGPFGGSFVNSGTGSLNILLGGVIHTGGNADIGKAAQYVGTVTVDGPGSLWTVANGLTIGDSGTGSVTVSSDGSLTAGDIRLGLSTGSIGTLTVENGGHVTSSNEVDVGGAGTAVLTIQTGAVVADAEGEIGGAGGTGTATVDAASWANSNALYVGSHGTGELTIRNGGSVYGGATIVGQGASGTLTVDGAGSSFAADVLTIGQNAVGLMTVQNGATATLTSGIVGGYAGTPIDNAVNGTLAIASGGVVAISDTAEVGLNTDPGLVANTGLVTVDGTGSAWNIDNVLTIGDLGGHGTVALTHGGYVSASNVFLGQTAGSEGTVTVDGVSSFLATQILSVGSFGTGSVTVSNGAALNAATMVLGDSGGSSGSMTITDPGSEINFITGLVVGNFGTGALSILNGAVANGDGATIGFHAGGNGTMLVDGAGSTLNLDHQLQIGSLAGANGALTVSGGGVVDIGGDLYLGYLAGGTGAATITGADSSLLITTGMLVVGEAGSGTLLVQDAATLIAHTLSVAASGGSTGALTVTGAGSAAAIDQLLLVGGDGDGSLSVLNGAALADFNATVADNTGTNGTALVDGASSTWTNRAALIVGNSGAGTLTISNGGSATGGSISAGSEADGNGVITVTGANSALTSSGAIYAGFGGTGQISVLAGGTVTGPETSLGTNTGSTGTVVVDGSGSTWNSALLFAVGVGGNGSLTISNGGRVSDMTGGMGDEAGSSGTVIVDGAGSRWDNSGTFVAGVFGTATATIRNGGAIAADAAYIGVQPGGNSVVTVTGVGSTFSSANELIVGGSMLPVATGGSGSLVILDGGAVSDDYGYIATKMGSSGTASIDGAGSIWNTTNRLQIGADGDGILTVSNDGLASVGGDIIVAANVGSTGVLNIGADAASAAAAPGAVQATSVTFGSGTGTINFNHTSDAYTFASPIAGAGTINQLAGATFLSGDSSEFTGTTNVMGGALHVNGFLGNSAVTVTGGGTLNGNGTVGAVAVQSGGIVGPGNSIGTLTVNGNYSAASGSVYQAEFNAAGQADRLSISGTATIASGAVLNLVKTDAGVSTAGTYTLLTAAGGLNGTFIVTGLAPASYFSSQVISYDANDVFLNIAKTKTFASVGLTPNQIAAGGGADTLPAGNMLGGALINLPSADTANAAFDQLSGDFHASVRSAMVEDSRFVRQAAIDRMRAHIGLSHPVVWSEAFGDWGSADSDGNAAGLNRSSAGFLGGVDVPVFDTWRVGVLGGYSHTNLSAAARNTAGDADSYHLGAYGGTQFGNIGVRAGAAYSWNGIDTRRAVAFNGFSDQLIGVYNSGTTQVFGDVGYHVEAGRVALEPFANAAYVSLNTGAFRESGGAAALGAAHSNDNVTFTTLGLRGSADFDLRNIVLTAHGSLGWRHTFGDVTPQAAFSFTGSQAFTIAGVPVAIDAAAIEAGVDAAVTDNLTLGVSYTGQLADGAQDNGVKANIGWKF